jgi:hypothetical protein
MAVRSPTRTHVTAARLAHPRPGRSLTAYGHAVRASRRFPGTHLVTFPIGGHLFVGQQRRIRIEASHFVQSALVVTLPPLLRSQRQARWFGSAASAARPFSSSASNALRIGPYGDAATREIDRRRGDSAAVPAHDQEPARPGHRAGLMFWLRLTSSPSSGAANRTEAVSRARELDLIP